MRKYLKAAAIETWQIETEALAGSRFNHGVEPAPLILSLHGVAGALTKPAATLLVPADQAKARLIEANQLNSFASSGLLLQEFGGKVF